MNVNTLFSREMRYKVAEGDCAPDYGTVFYEDIYNFEKLPVTIIKSPYVDVLRGKDGFWAKGLDQRGGKYIIHWEILADTFDNGLPDEKCCEWDEYNIWTEQEFYE
jgi:hypothetical protein